MICVGLTGGIGSGKTYVSRILERLGIPVYNADLRARYLMENDKVLIGQLTEAFGPEIYKSGELQRSKLAELVFNDKSELEKLNSLVHPAVRADFKAWYDDQEAPYVIREAAILFESGSDVDCDKIVLVTAPEELRISRVVERDGGTREDVRKRMENQWPDEKKRPLSDFVIENDNKGMLLPKVMEVHQALIAIAAKG